MLKTKNCTFVDFYKTMSHFKRIKHTIRTLIILTLVIYFGIIILLSIPLSKSKSVIMPARNCIVCFALKSI